MFPLHTRVLIVDDASVMVVNIKRLLVDIGFQDILVAASGKESLEILRQAHAGSQPIGLMLCDWNMPEMDGLEVLKTLRSDPVLEKLPFVMVTAENDPRHVVEAARAGVSNYIVKPFNQTALSEMLSRTWMMLVEREKKGT